MIIDHPSIWILTPEDLPLKRLSVCARFPLVSYFDGDVSSTDKLEVVNRESLLHPPSCLMRDGRPEGESPGGPRISSLYRDIHIDGQRSDLAINLKSYILFNSNIQQI